jgi:hypothetical protein
MFDALELKTIMNVPFTIVIASFIIIVITTSMTDSNALSALIGGYSGYLLGMLFVVILSQMFMKTGYLEMFPMLVTIIITGFLLFYLGTYFDRIASGEISSYYYNFSILSTIFLLVQTAIIFTSLFSNLNSNSNNSGNIKIFSDTTFSVLGLLGVINFLLVLTIGIILNYYSTQG